MYQAILDAMVSEAKPRPALTQAARGLAAATTLLPRDWLRQTAPRPSLPLLPLQGLLGSRIGCGVCGFRSSLKVVAFESVSLALPRVPTSRATALDVLLHDHFRAEQINDYQCPRCSLLATRRTLVSSLPAASVIRTLANAAVAGRPPAKSHTAVALARSENVRSLQTLHDVQRVLDTGDYDALDTVSNCRRCVGPGPGRARAGQDRRGGWQGRAGQDRRGVGLGWAEQSRAGQGWAGARLPTGADDGKDGAWHAPADES